MKCPICHQEVTIKNKKITADDSEAAVQRYAVCKDCHKQWNLERKKDAREFTGTHHPLRSTHEKALLIPLRILMAIFSCLAFGVLFYRLFLTTAAISPAYLWHAQQRWMLLLLIAFFVGGLLYAFTFQHNQWGLFATPLLFYLGAGVYGVLQSHTEMLMYGIVFGSLLFAILSAIIFVFSIKRLRVSY